MVLFLRAIYIERERKRERERERLSNIIKIQASIFIKYVEYLSAGSKKIYYNASASYRPLRNPLLHL
jgi:hypothetical protein